MATASLESPDAPPAVTPDENDLSRREMYAAIRKLCAPDNYTNWFVLAREYAVYALFVTGCLYGHYALAAHGWSWWWNVPLYLVTVFAIGFWSQTRLACLVHESSHYLLFKNRVLNDVVANLLVVFPFFGKVGNYRIGHWGHHRHVNDKEHDPDLLRLKKHHPRHFPISKWRFLWEYLLLQLSPHKAYTYLKGRAEYVTFAMKEEGAKLPQPLPQWAEPPLRIGYYAALFGTLAWNGWLPHYFLFWVVPLVTFYPASLFLREIAHHGNYPDNGDFTNSRVYEGRWLEREIFFPFGEWNHVLHHMFPTIPWHKTRQAHATMMRYRPYRENVVICDGFFVKGGMGPQYPTVLDVLSKPSHAYLQPALQQETAHQESDTPETAAAEEVGTIRSKTGGEVGAMRPPKVVLVSGES